MSETGHRTHREGQRWETVSYERARVTIVPEGPFHYRVVVSEAPGHRVEHAVERVVINTGPVYLDGPIWFVDAKVDVGVPVTGPEETVWVWV